MDIAILGGGVAGLSAAIALKQAGFEVDVYERHSQVTEIGAGIVCWPNASFVLDQLGVLKQVASVSGAITKMRRFSSTGEPLGSLDIEQLNQLMGYDSYSIIRKDLMNILTQRALELNINIHYQHDVLSLQDNDSGKVSVQFSNGNNIQPALIIGCDGRMKSLARAYVKGENKPVYQGFINWIGVIESESEIFTQCSVADYWGVGQRFGIVPVSKNKAYWAGGVAAKEKAETIPQLYKGELNALFDHWPNPISKVINDTALSRINKIYVHDHDPISSWHKNNVVLLGDAAHSPLPTSGQGACQALESAWHLVQCLNDNRHDLPQVFKQFTATRLAKTTGITMGGRQLASSIFNQNEAYCKQRDLASINADYQAAVVGMTKVWAGGLPIAH